jgi:Holliday junction resolvase-like predicted endonuclease
MKPSERRHFGQKLEEEAWLWLEQKQKDSEIPYRLLAKNFYARRGELDLVMEEGAGPQLELVIIEVRGRGEGAWQTHLEVIDFSKLQSLRRATEAFLLQYQGQARSLRIDLLFWDNGVWSWFRNIDPGVGCSK